MVAKELNIGLIGCGFMGRAHSNAYRKVNQFFPLEYRPVMKAACARNAEKLQAFADNWGWESCETDWRRLIERRHIDVVDIASPNDTHREIALAAAQAGKMVLCEKPLARNGDEGRAMTQAVEKAGVPNMVWFNYRRVPAIALARQVIDEGRIGRAYHYRAQCLQDWTMSAELTRCPKCSGANLVVQVERERELAAVFDHQELFGRPRRGAQHCPPARPTKNWVTGGALTP